MKLKPKYVKAIIYGAGVLLFAASVVWVKPKMDDKHDQLQAANDQLNDQLSQLEELEAKATDYENDAKAFQEESQKIIDKFPPEVRPEDVILYAKDIEDKDKMSIATIGVTEGNLIYSMNSAPVDAAAAPVEETAAGTDAAAAPVEETAAGTDAAADGAEAPVDTATALGILDEASVVKPDYNLFQMSVSYDVTSSYRDLKNVVSRILEDSDKQNVEGVSLAYDQETGELAGTMNINRYFLTGTDKEYVAPDAGNIKKGTNNIFGTIESSR